MAIQKPIEDIEQIEQRLVGLSQQIAQSSNVLDNLSAVQTQFEDLAQTYESFKTYSLKVKQKSQNLEVFKVDAEQRIVELEQTLGTVKSAFDSIQQDWENPREVVEIYLDNMENRLRTELRGALSQLDQSGLSPAHLDKLEKLDTQVRALRTNLRTSERRGRILQNWLVVTSIVAAVSLGLPLVSSLTGRAQQAQQPPASQAEAPETESEAASGAEGEGEAQAENEFTPTSDFSSTIGQ